MQAWLSPEKGHHFWMTAKIDNHVGDVEPSTAGGGSSAGGGPASSGVDPGSTGWIQRAAAARQGAGGAAV